MTMLPVDSTISSLIIALQEHRNAVLQAPPGAGKTTRVPLALLRVPWLHRQRIIMLEPRRLAARAAARYLARQLGEDVGGTVGYRVRLDTRVSHATRLEVVTEGVLTRMLQSDPSLAHVGLIIFDEFHERSIHADLGLALSLQARTLFRPDLALLVMSATLQSERVAALLNDAPILTSAGRAFPVETNYLAKKLDGPIEPAVTRTVQDALTSQAGDVLVFLPGQAEIQRVHAQLLESRLPAGTDLYPLFGNLSAEQQDLAIEPSPAGRRKVVLATSIAETSLTIDGVRIVIDCGLMRVPRFSPRTGMARLETVRVSRASADQRRGRAGRTSAGICHRLWTEGEQAALLDHGEPEIVQADLAPLALDLAVWGVPDPLELRWLDPPPAAAFAQAHELLRELGALDAAGALTPHGARMAELALHPRLAHMVLRASVLGVGPLAADLAALLGERDVLRGQRDPDLMLRLHALRALRHDADLPTLQRVRGEAREIRRHLARITGLASTSSSDDLAGVLLACAYPDRIARRRAGARGRFLMRNGRGASVEPASALAASEYMVAAQVDDRGPETRVFLGAALTEAELEAHFADQFESKRDLDLEVESGEAHVRARERVHLGAIVITERALQPEPEERSAALLDGVRRHGLALLPWSLAAQQLRSRIAFLHTLDAGWPDVSDSALLETLDAWLAPDLQRQSQFHRIDMMHALQRLLSWQQRAHLDDLAPTHMEAPSGSRIPIDYADPLAPALAVRLQEVFGWRETPRVGGGRVPLVLHLLSPAQRPVQVTRDLASFWRSGYFEVRKDLKGRYPKHYWPDDPLSATPTRRVRPPK
ncbi:MAG: ATP-dependent helicase HrpB [Longimicrobiales bacterium]